MDNNAYIKLIRDDNKTFIIGRNHDWRFKTEGLEGFSSFDSDINYIDNGTMDGGMITSTRLSKIDRTISCAYVLPSLNDVARREATAFFNAKSTYKVYCYYAGRTRWQEAKILKFEIGTAPDLAKRLDLAVTFEFPNPYWNSEDNFGKDIASIEAKTAFPYISLVDKGYITGLFNFAKQVDLTNDGDIDTYCTAVFKASGAVSNPKLIINDEYVRVIDELEAGDVIIMDFTAMPPTIKKNGANYIGHCDRTSAFDSMTLGTGTTAVAFDADDGSDNLAVNIYYNKLYASI